MTPSTKRCASIFDLAPIKPKIYSPKFAQNPLISRLVWQIDRRCLRLLRSFRGWPIQWNHAKCCGADPCCHGNDIWARCGDLVAYRFVLRCASQDAYARIMGFMCERSGSYIWTLSARRVSVLRRAVRDHGGTVQRHRTHNAAAPGRTVRWRGYVTARLAGCGMRRRAPTHTRRGLQRPNRSIPPAAAAARRPPPPPPRRVARCFRLRRSQP